MMMTLHSAIIFEASPPPLCLAPLLKPHSHQRWKTDSSQKKSVDHYCTNTRGVITDSILYCFIVNIFFLPGTMKARVRQEASQAWKRKWASGHIAAGALLSLWNSV